MKNNNKQIRNDIETEDKNSKSYKMIEDINYKIAELLEMNPDYKVLIHKHKPNDFFYNKGKYLHNRYNQLIDEMKRRGFKPDSSRVFPKEIFVDNNLYNDWLPRVEDYNVIKQRIEEKIALKPDWYRKTIGI